MGDLLLHRRLDHGFPESSDRKDEVAVRVLAELVRAHLAHHLA